MVHQYREKKDNPGTPPFTRPEDASVELEALIKEAQLRYGELEKIWKRIDGLNAAIQSALQTVEAPKRKLELRKPDSLPDPA